MERRREQLELTQEQVEACLERAEPSAHLAAWRPLEGGLANATFALDLASGARRVLRVLLGDPRGAAKETALLSALAGRPELPVPALIAAVSPGAVEGLPFPALLLERLPGQAFDRALPSLPAAVFPDLGRQVGLASARIQALEFACPGDLVAEDGRLRVEAWDFGGPPGLPASVAFGLTCLEGAAGRRLGALAAPLGAYLREGAARWPELQGAARLVHGDFKPCNLLVELEAGRARLSGVLDWEFAHAGTPLGDYGNLFRAREPGLPPAFEAGVVVGLKEGGVDLPADWREQRAYVDLTSALDFLSSAQDLPRRHAASRAQIEATLRAVGRP